MPESWSHLEVEAAVADYFAMLDLELRGEYFNKAEHNRGLQQLLQNRTKSSIERKHQNISAILIELGYPYIDGYKPLGNYQELLGDVVGRRISRDRSFDKTVEATVHAEISRFKTDLPILVGAPSTEPGGSRIYERAGSYKVPLGRNYLEIEARNRSLGSAGEELVMRFEHERLWKAGQQMLADRIQHVSESVGDHLGYDILSFETSGEERLIEVKTTQFGAMTPFFASQNEVRISEERSHTYQLYRIFKFRDAPKLFVLPGSMKKTCQLTPTNFSATPA